MSEDKEKKIVITLQPRDPRFEMEPLLPGTPEQELMIDVRQMMGTSDSSLGYLIFARMMNMRNLVSQDGEKPKVLCVVRPQPGHNFELGINMEVFGRLSMAARMELLKEQLLRIPYGHFSSRARRLIARYGKEITERASQMVLSQVVDASILAEDGVILPVPEMWDFSRGLTMEEYAELLCEEGGGTMPMPLKMIVTSSGDGKTVEINIEGMDADLKALLDENGLTKLDTLNETASSDDARLDSATKAFMQRLESAMKAQNTSLKQQGWARGEVFDLIEQLDRPPRLNITYYIRRMVSRYIGPNKQLTWRRYNRKAPLLPAITKPRVKWVKFSPGTKRKRQPSVLTWIDTSGSMTKTELRCCQTEQNGIVSKGVRALVGFIDAGIAKEPVPFKRGDKLDGFPGRGGTDFRPAFKWVEESMRKDPPSFIIYITDGYGTAPKEPFELPVLWVLTSTGMKPEDFKKTVADWGDVCVLDVGD